MCNNFMLLVAARALKIIDSRVNDLKFEAYSDDVMQLSSVIRYDVIF